MPLLNHQRHPCRSPKALQSLMQCLLLTKTTWRSSATHLAPHKLHVSYYFPCDIDFPTFTFYRFNMPIIFIKNLPSMLSVETHREHQTTQQHNNILVLNDTSPSTETSILSTRRCWYNSTSSGIMYDID